MYSSLIVNNVVHKDSKSRLAKDVTMARSRNKAIKATSESVTFRRLELVSNFSSVDVGAIFVGPQMKVKDIRVRVRS